MGRWLPCPIQCAVKLHHAQGQGAGLIGAEDIEEKITHMAGATSPQGLTEDDLMALIREARREPVQRDTVYRSLEAVHA